MQRLPTLIFADENHTSSLLSNILTKLAPRLKQIGYENFYCELPSNLSIEKVKTNLVDSLGESKNTQAVISHQVRDFIVYLKQFEISFSRVPELLYPLAMRKLDELLIKSDTDKTKFQGYVVITMMMACIKQQIGGNVNLAVLEEMLAEACVEILKVSQNIQTSIVAMMDAIATAQLKYKGIDDPSLSMDDFKMDTIKGVNNIYTAFHNKAFISNRDKIMAEAYSKPAEPVFGFTGLAHVEGMQELINKWIPSDIARANFDFIYIFHESNINESLFLPDIAKIRNDYRQKKVPLPLGLTLIDGLNKTEDEIVELVMQHVNERIVEFKELPDHLKVIPDITLMGQARAKWNQMYGFFSQTANDIGSAVTNSIWGHQHGPEAEVSAKKQKL